MHANVQKSQIYGTYKYFFDVPMSMTTIDKRTHAFKRRINVRALTDDTFKSMEDTVLKSVRTLCGMLIDGDGDNEWSSARNMTTLTSYVTSDIMGDMSFSRNWNVLESDENRDIVEFLPQGVAGVNLVSFSRHLRLANADSFLDLQTGYMPIILHLKLDKLFFRKLTRDVYRFKALSQAQSDWRMAQGDTMEHRDILATLIDAMDPETGKGLSHKEIISEAGLLIIAGSDTMGTTITATLFYLLHNPQVLGRLQHEIWHTFANVEDIRMGTELSSCHYLTACLSETLRFTPPVGASLPREVCAGGIIVDGLFFPPGIDLSVPAYGLHHNETYFPDSFTYKPERWIVGEEGTTKESLALAQSAYHPFGVGRTSCIGKRLAYTEMSIIVARILWLFELRLQPGSRVGEGHPGLGEYREQTNEYQTKDIFVSAHDGPMIEFKRRSVVPVQEE